MRAVMRSPQKPAIRRPSTPPPADYSDEVTSEHIDALKEIVSKGPEREQPVITALDFQRAVYAMPSAMMAKRRLMMPKKLGFQPGIRGAAEAAGISPATYHRAERGENVDLATMHKILEWLETDKQRPGGSDE